MVEKKSHLFLFSIQLHKYNLLRKDSAFCLVAEIRLLAASVENAPLAAEATSSFSLAGGKPRLFPSKIRGKLPSDLGLTN